MARNEPLPEPEDAEYVVLTEDGIEKWRQYTDRVYDHFGSDAAYEAYMNGLIDLDGNELG